MAIIGRVGCGKTTLLNTIIQETFIQSGELYVRSGELTATLAEQNPLIVTGTVRSNITYGTAFDREHYDAVVRACQLTQDFESFPQGDLTATGEMGVSLSGGQKSRISLARALYRKNSKIILIDGTLSSLDARVAHSIISEIK